MYLPKEYVLLTVHQPKADTTNLFYWMNERKKNRRNLIRAQIIICEMNKHRKRIKLFVNSKIVFFFLIKPDYSSKKYLSLNYTPFNNN